MTPKKQPLPRSFVPLLVIVSVVLILTAPGCGGSSSGPSPVPTATPTPTMTLVDEQNFQTVLGFVGPTGFSPQANTAGTFTFIAEWTPTPPAGNIYLFVVSGQGQQERVDCVNRNFVCPYILARDDTAGYPKRVEYRVTAGQRVFWWTRPTTGDVQGTVKIYFLPG